MNLAIVPAFSNLESIFSEALTSRGFGGSCCRNPSPRVGKGGAEMPATPILQLFLRLCPHIQTRVDMSSPQGDGVLGALVHISYKQIVYLGCSFLSCSVIYAFCKNFPFLLEPEPEHMLAFQIPPGFAFSTLYLETQPKRRHFS